MTTLSIDLMPATVDRLSDGFRATATGQVDVEVVRTVRTASGFVTEHVETVRGPQGLVARHLWLCEVGNGRIAEAVGYRNGGWDDALRVRHAAEAPMLRPEPDRRGGHHVQRTSAKE